MSEPINSGRTMTIQTQTPGGQSEPIKPATAPATDKQLKIWQERPCGDTQCRCTELHLDQAIARIQSDAAKHAAALKDRDEQITNLRTVAELMIGKTVCCGRCTICNYGSPHGHYSGCVVLVLQDLIRQKEASRG